RVPLAPYVGGAQRPAGLQSREPRLSDLRSRRVPALQEGRAAERGVRAPAARPEAVVDPGAEGALVEPRAYSTRPPTGPPPRRRSCRRRGSGRGSGSPGARSSRTARTPAPGRPRAGSSPAAASPTGSEARPSRSPGGRGTPPAPGVELLHRLDRAHLQLVGADPARLVDDVVAVVELPVPADDVLLTLGVDRLVVGRPRDRRQDHELDRVDVVLEREVRGCVDR